MHCSEANIFVVNICDDNHDKTIVVVVEKGIKIINNYTTVEHEIAILLK